MGNIIGLNYNQNEDVSSTIPYLEKLNQDTKTLIKNLKVPEVDELVFTETENYDKFKIFQQNNHSSRNDNLSETSPFISEDFYNKIMNQSSQTPQQHGGGESSTTSSSDDVPKKLPKADEMDEDFEPDMDEISTEMSDLEMSQSMNLDMSTGSYLSSSAHTDGIENSSDITTISVGNDRVLSDSINTSDINMISVEE
jgi:hypothetical protein